MKAIVTGHTRGLGAALAEDLLGRGIAVLGIARHGNAPLATRFPDALTQEQLDLADLDALTHWLGGEHLRRFVAGSKTVLLINNAGVVQPVGPLPVQDPGAVARAVVLNVAAPLALASALLAASPDTPDRRILHISSGAARSAYPGWSVYCATKAALDHHARAVVLDQIPGLRICSLAPGVIDTDMQAEIRATSLEQFPLRERFQALKRDGGLADPEVCAKHLIDYLLSAHFGSVPVADLRDMG
jgi:benzil reductase ((S)-benzoin forming)